MKILFEIKCLIKGKWGQFLELMGLRITPDWLLLRVMIRELGVEKAQDLYAQSILLDMDCNGIPTKKRHEMIVNKTLYKGK
jgi:hypothetical protein